MGSHQGCQVLFCTSRRNVRLLLRCCSGQGQFSCSVVSDSATPWTVAHQAPLSMEFSRQEYLSGLPLPSPGHLPYPGIKPGSPASKADSYTSSTLHSALLAHPLPVLSWEAPPYLFALIYVLLLLLLLLSRLDSSPQGSPVPGILQVTPTTARAVRIPQGLAELSHYTH